MLLRLSSALSRPVKSLVHLAKLPARSDGISTLPNGVFTSRGVQHYPVKSFSTGRCKRRADSSRSQNAGRGKSTVYYVVALGVFVGGMSYAAVPIYRLFCQSYSYGGTTSGHNAEGIESMKPNRSRILKIRFNADTSSNLTWNFRPQQTELKVALGETALAFYTATNPTDRPIDGISTYNVVPFEAGQYFNKIQCFCFEEQRLNPHEQVDMPVFFYIDPEFAEDPRMENVETITLSYTFFEAKEGAHFIQPNAHPKSAKK